MQKTRNLYLIRHHRLGYIFGKAIGFKCRLLPRHIAFRIAKRLRLYGLDISIGAVPVNVTPEQADYLDRRYPRGRMPKP